MSNDTYELRRTVRFCIHPHAGTSLDSAERHNTFAAWPSMCGLGAFYELRISCRGKPDPMTGYMMNISVIDEHVRRVALPEIERAFQERPTTDPGLLLAELLAPLNAALGGTLHSIRWQLTPYYAIIMTIHAPDRVLISQQFEFAASHRLHCPSLTEEENQHVFGKCNNASGHGHNYRLEPVVAVELGEGREPPTMNVTTLERIVDEHIIRRYDHKHLNLDTEDFADLNPSVEHIARTCYQRLADPVARAGGTLVAVTVWETEKTSCTYPASAAT